jgi:molybdate transport system substrate-binding protein
MAFWILRARQLAAAALLVLTGAFTSVAPVWAQRAETTDITVFAAASLKNALDAVTADYLKATGNKVAISYAASSALAKQIEQAAPADLFISADLEWMDYLAQKSLIKADSEIKFLGNHLVLVAPATSNSTLKITSGFALADALGPGRLAVADINAVPAGKYAKAALEKLGVFESVKAKIAQAENVRAALALVARDEAPFGIVYQTDANAEPKVKVVDTFPEDTHPAIVYPLAITSAAKNPDAAAAFVTYLTTADVKARFIKEGFTMLK